MTQKEIKKLRYLRKIKRLKNKTFTVKHNNRILLTPNAVSVIIKSCSIPTFEKEKIERAMKELKNLK